MSDDYILCENERTRKEFILKISDLSYKRLCYNPTHGNAAPGFAHPGRR